MTSSLRASVAGAAFVAILLLTIPAWSQGEAETRNSPATQKEAVRDAWMVEEEVGEAEQQRIERSLLQRAPLTEADAKPAEDLPSSVTLQRRWYGWQTLLSDGLVISAFILAENLDGEEPHPAAGPLFTVSILGYFVAPAGLHLAHDNGLLGAASLGMRIGLPLLGMSVGAALSEDRGGEDTCNACIDYGVLYGAGAGLIGAMIFDASLATWKPKAPSSATMALVPSVCRGSLALDNTSCGGGHAAILATGTW